MAEGTVLRESMFSRWGLLPVALAMGWVVVACAGALAFGPGGRARDRALGGVVLAAGATAVVVRVLGAVGGLATGPLLASLAVLALSLAVLLRRRGGSVRSAMALPFRRVLSGEIGAILLAAIATILVTGAAAYLLPIWQWDALGYHLPFVDFALQARALDGVPKDVPYLSTYPHVTELLFVAFRAMLPDDRLVDLAQLPFGLFGALSIAAIAQREGARAPHAAAAGLLWLTLPAVFLQLPTNYVDVASAAYLLAACYFVLGEATPANLVLSGVALGLFLGSKPNAPIGTALLGGVLVWSAMRAKAYRPLAIAIGSMLVLGSETYLDNLIRHHNPIWPIRAQLGPIHLPGTQPMSLVLESGAAAPRAHGPLLLRMARSWTALGAPPAFDMRLGGLGMVFLGTLPFAGFTLARKVREARATGSRFALLALAAAFVASVASPDPSVARYVLACPALLLAFAAPAFGRLAALPRAAVLGALGVLASVELVRSADGLAGEGPSLLSYVGMTDTQRAFAVGADGPPWPMLEAVARVRPGETTAFDASFDLPHLAWPSDLSTRVVRLPDHPSPAEIARVADDPTIRLLVIDDLSPLAAVARARQEQFASLFHCKSTRCNVYLRR